MREEGPTVILTVGGDADAAALRQALSTGCEVLPAPAPLLQAVMADDPGEASLVLRDWLDGRSLRGAVVDAYSTSGEAIASAPRAELAPAVAVLRPAFAWSRLLAGALEGGAGGSVVLPLPAAAPDNLAASVYVHGIVGLARSASVTMAPRGVRFHAVARSPADAATFAGLVAALTTPELTWLSGWLLGTTGTDVAVYTPDEAQWQVFAEPKLSERWIDRIDDVVHGRTRSLWDREPHKSAPPLLASG